MKRVAVLGANGQVASEVVLRLAWGGALAPIGVVRTDYAGVLLRLAGVPCRVVGSLDDAARVAAALADADVVVDLTYPSGELTDIPARLKRNLAVILGSMPARARYVHMSSVMAFGVGWSESPLRRRSPARTAYGTIKRKGERWALSLGRRHEVEVHVFRLGQVHGDLQAVTALWRSLAARSPLRFRGAPSDPTNTLFTGAIVQAIEAVSRGGLPPGEVRALVSVPQWTLADLAAFYRDRYGLAEPAQFVAPAPQAGGPLRRALALASKPDVRELLEAHVLIRSPRLYRRLKGRHRMANARRPPAGREAHVIESILGAVPGPAVPDLQTSSDRTLRDERSFADAYERLLSAARRPPAPGTH